jgi:hypothetical protein
MGVSHEVKKLMTDDAKECGQMQNFVRESEGTLNGE